MERAIAERKYKNAVLDDKELQIALKAINPKFGDFVTRIAGEAWGLPLIDQKTKAFIAIAIDVVNQNHTGSGNPFAAHIGMAIKQGATREQIEELLLFLCVYAGFNKVAGCFGALNQILGPSSFEQRRPAMIATMRRGDYALRDQKGKVAFYVLLWKRKGISLELFDDYWRNVHGPVCARIPGQYQYWQFHVAHNEGGIWPTVAGVNSTSAEEDQFDGIAELTFVSEADRQLWFKDSAILMDDEHNIFSKAIGYNSSPDNSITYVDGIPTGDPNGNLGILKFHVLVKKADAVSIPEFRRYMKDILAPTLSNSESVLKFRLHLFEEVDNSRPDAAGVSHYEPAEKQYQAAFEIAFSNNLEMEKFFTSKEFAEATAEQGKYVKEINPFPERTAYTFVYDGQMTLAGQRGSKVAELIENIGATNQLKEDVVSLMVGNPEGEKSGLGHLIQQVQPQAANQPQKSGLGHLLQGVQHFGVTVDDINKSLEFYCEVLGGKFVIGEQGLVGDEMQNNLFQREELEAIARGVDPQTTGIPDLRNSREALDVRFISFGNVSVELIHFRDPAQPNAARTSVGTIPSQIGNVNAMHLSFHLKDDVDIDTFAETLEEECRRRGITNVICNRVIRVKSEAERRAVARKYNSVKFWDDPESIAAGHPKHDYGEFEGWSLFYCKGPSGEQLEFNQVTRKVKHKFAQAQKDYDQANGTNFSASSEKSSATGANSMISSERPTSSVSSNPNTGSQSLLKEKLPGTNADLVKRLFARGEAFDSEGFTTFFTDTPIYQFGNFEPCLNKADIKQSADNFFSRINAVYHDIKMMWEVGNIVFVEMDVVYWRKDGSVIALPCTDIFRVEGDKFSELRIFMDVNPVFDPSIRVSQTTSVMTVNTIQRINSTNLMKRFFAEDTEGVQRIANGYRPKWSVSGPKWSINSNGYGSNVNTVEMTEKMPGKTSELVLRLFSRGEAFDSEGFTTFFTDTPLYQFGNFDLALDKNTIKQSADNFFSRINAVYHDIKMLWELGDVVFVEMDVTYWRKDGSVITLPCCDIFRVEGDKFSELRIFMDVNPVFNPSIPVSPLSSVMTIGEGRRLTPPETMKKFFGEHPEAKKRVTTGYAPKWSIANPPGWTIPTTTEEESGTNFISKVEKMVDALTVEDWNSFYPYFTPNMMYKVGANPPLYGAHAAAQYLSSFYTIIKPTKHDVRGAWQIGNTVIIEMDAHYRRIKDGKIITVPCTDVYRFEGDLIKEWRVYPDVAEVYSNG